MKRLIRLCDVCGGDGTMYNAECGACEGRGQVGESVRIVSLNPSANHGVNKVIKPLPLLDRRVKLFDSTAAVVAMGVGFDLLIGTTPFAPVSTAMSAVLNQVPLGVSQGQRLGRRLTMKTLRIRGSFEITSASDMDQMCTLWLIYQKIVNQSTMPTLATLFTQQHPDALPALSSIAEFEFLFEKTLVCVGNRTTPLVTDMSVQLFDFTVDLEQRLTMFSTSDTTGSYNNMQVGGLYLYVLGNRTAALSGSLSLSTRLEFCDP